MSSREVAEEKEIEAVVRYLAHCVKQGETCYYEGSGKRMSHVDG